MKNQLPDDWRRELAESIEADWFVQLDEFVRRERTAAVVYPPHDQVFRAFQLTPFSQVRTVILGQDPYHGEGQANGLCFSVQQGVKHPPSLRNIFKERETDLSMTPPVAGNLDAWARQGVLLLNTVLTVRESQANSHQKRGWERLTDDAIRRVGEHSEPCIFVLWGKPAQKKRSLIDTSRHRIIESAHPSPLSAFRGFFDSRPFSLVNKHLAELGRGSIDWRVDEEYR
jgi:uracil-DNA glycosylase